MGAARWPSSEVYPWPPPEVPNRTGASWCTAQVAARVEASLATGAEADQLFPEALRAHAATEGLLDRSRTLRLYGVGRRLVGRARRCQTRPR